MKDMNLSKKTQKLIFFIAVAVIIALSVLIFRFVGIPMMNYVKEPGQFRAWVDSHGFVGRLAFAGMMMLQVVVAIIPGEPLEIFAGYAFGALEGTLLCIASQTIGGLFVFLLVRRYGTRIAEIFFSGEKLRSLRFLKYSKKRDVLFFIIFMIPGTPKDLICYFAGLTDIKISAWLLISVLGRIPSVVTSTIGGDAMGTKKYLFSLIVFAATFAVSLIGLWIYNKICKIHERREAEKKENSEK